jgi:transposase
MEVLPMPKTYKQVVTQFHTTVRDTIVSRPEMSYAQIAKQFGISEVTVHNIAVQFGVGRIKTGPKPSWLKKAVKAVV